MSMIRGGLLNPDVNPVVLEREYGAGLLTAVCGGGELYLLFNLQPDEMPALAVTGLGVMASLQLLY
ncbi:TPA: hypothetical protein ACGSGD_000907 [Escherichia coli]|uniref:hypothetical protein n=1 Tax=Escherichia coli TaxID=562 RepID=UPI002858DF0A|nr:hypothetical protein [Escherichia coli]ELL7394420.1 hypothetical protein [Escherichia coli]ELX1468313.1 hypothetical protein [Escherichia coli]